MIALAILLLRNLLAKFTLRREQPAIHNLKTFVVFGFGQRNLPQVIDQASARLSKQFSIAPHALTSTHASLKIAHMSEICRHRIVQRSSICTALGRDRNQLFTNRRKKSPEVTSHRSSPRKWWEAIHA
jgi:hypothetical protein